MASVTTGYPVLVVGAGPVGLTMAAELARHGVRCRLIDRAPAQLPYCRAIGVTPRTLEVWEDMGVSTQMIDRGLFYLRYTTGMPAENMRKHGAEIVADYIERYAGELGIQCFGAFGELNLDGKAIAIAHGDDERALRRVLDGQKHDYLFVGHSHVKADGRVGRVRVINPGALHRAREKTVATLDLTSDRLRFHVVTV